MPDKNKRWLKLLNKIGYFQLDNLINNRVPFAFYNMGPSILEWYGSVSRLHLENYQRLLSADEVLADLTARKVPKDFAIVLLCEDGKQSMQLFSELQKESYTNVYVIDGGYQQMVTDRSQL